MQDPDGQKVLAGPLFRPAQPGLEVTQPTHDGYDAVTATPYGPGAHTLRQAESQQRLRPRVSQPDFSLPQRAGSARSDPCEGPIPHYPSANPSSWGPGPHDAGQGPVRMEAFKIDEPPPLQPKEPTRILGLRVLTFWLVILALVLVVSAGLAAGLTVGLQRRSIIAASTAATGTNVQGVSSPAPTNPWCPRASSGVATVTPNDASGTSIRLSTEVAQTFAIQCDTQYPAGRGAGNPGVRDILLAYAPDMLACVALCAQYNAGYSNAVGDDAAVGAGLCVAVSLVKADAEFCYLKNATGVNDTRANVAEGVGVDSAVLLGDWASLSEGQLWERFGGASRVFGNESFGV
ncbi:uncharacterized protein JN550_006336 [Neoarthrinium moseri]|uniref:uncharacterized protein n=1 Tax=Neoarthrinium moseri TaxID=1658444 RepID=UPI001FDE8444|nr:uncharacterized protein JN550_006336 [Neoarthrinium moseri]KAI1868420.1 hypothetical protein JN550_006336 [Neoarthrinium moseri]